MDSQGPRPVVDEEIARASTLPSEFYRDPAYFERARDRIFARSWQWIADTDRLKARGQLYPFTLLPGCLDEPLLLTRAPDDRLHCLSNVCTHRGSLLVDGPGCAQVIRCRYHGRRFALDGRFLSMPEFEGAAGFPSSADDLPRASFGTWGKFLFASLSPPFPLEDLLRPLLQRVGWMPLDAFLFEPTRSREYLVQANWALYCDNYLEGFHVPYVHPDLSRGLDAKAYQTELYSYSSVQIAAGLDEGDCFSLPPASPDHGKSIAAYYFWLFPNTMLNFYPWGLSINVVIPLGPDRTRVSFFSYVWDASRLSSGAGAELDRVEREDEAVVEAVQKGIGSRLYRRGRYSPSQERGVHHFHRLMTKFLSE